ncbi:glycosyltransferase [Paludibacter sp. 221]|uniref:glycosyltransferase n=1 Tax=Paludibacter sp. 221 TaxID=2302939 RepID=UPI0013CF6FA0|nr:glycosyltransferase [Paludibacter sp. 221]NDV47425.1 glycosyltransferase [Paludibacter sp. 221]
MKDVLAIVVLYKTQINESKSIRTLNELMNSSDDLDNIDLLIYDNSPVSNQAAPSFNKINSTYVSDGHNSGLSTAYNYGISLAKKLSKTWILLLDQDTCLETTYLTELKNTLYSAVKPDTVAIVPKLIKGKRHLSPIKNRSESNIWWFQQDITQSGYYSGEFIVAFNSGTLLNVSFIDSIGGFSSKYSLDRLDYWYFYQIYLQKKQIYVLNTTMEHDLSLLNYDEYMTADRYKSILKSEISFANEIGFYCVLLYKLSLLFRFFKQLFLFKKKQYAFLTFNQLWKFR